MARPIGLKDGAEVRKADLIGHAANAAKGVLIVRAKGAATRLALEAIVPVPIVAEVMARMAVPATGPSVVQAKVPEVAAAIAPMARRKAALAVVPVRE